MTVGIAAIIDQDRAIILVTDQMFNVGAATVDIPTAAKSFRFHNRWSALWAGDVTLVPPILRKVAAELSTNSSGDIAEVSSAFARVYRDEWARFAEQEVLAPFGLDMQAFVELLANKETAELSEMKRRIQDVDFDVEFLVAGFDSKAKPHIFTVTPPGVERHYDAIRFWSIGSGAEAALSSLMFRRLNPVMPLKQAIYHVAEAKYLSESSLAVGRGSLSILITSDGKFSMLYRQDEKDLRDLWETEGQPPIPADLDTRVPDFKTPEEPMPSTSEDSPSDSEKSEG
jgi:20S proteasome alpha/beta subunit